MKIINLTKQAELMVEHYTAHQDHIVKSIEDRIHNAIISRNHIDHEIAMVEKALLQTIKTRDQFIEILSLWWYINDWKIIQSEEYNLSEEQVDHLNNITEYINKYTIWTWRDCE